MGSFYGNVGIGTGSGNGPSIESYNELKDRPIKNLLGLSAINLQELDYGLYNFKGNYIYSKNDSDTKTIRQFTLLQIFEDDLGRKIVKFEYHKDDKHYVKFLTYYDEGLYEEKDFIYENEVLVSVKEETILPEEGRPDKIYVTDNGLFVWNKDTENYVQLGTEGETQWMDLK